MVEKLFEEKALAPLDERLEGLYGLSYFEKYQEDPQREACYCMERQRLLSMKPGGRILDVGCGLGKFLEGFDASRWEKYGIDLSDVAVQEARSRGIQVKDYAEAYDYPQEWFDVIVFRGSIQHLDTPFAAMKRCVELLKPGGLMAFLATPNSNSLCYKLFGTLPFLHPRFNFWIPSDVTLRDTLVNFGMEVSQIFYPYLETPYAQPFRDHFFFLLRCVGVPVRFAFWGNLMEMYAIKPGVTA